MDHDRSAWSAPKGVEGYQERFRTAPIGCWYGRDQELMIHGVYGEFRPDHTGAVLDTELMHPFQRTLFRWREVADFTIELQVTARQECLRVTPEGITLWQDEEQEPDELPEEWFQVEYTFTQLDGARPDIVMHTPGSRTFNALGLSSEGPLVLDRSQGHRK